MNNKQPFAGSDELKHPGMVVFLIITGILGLDLLIIVSGIDLVTLSTATLISGLLIYLLLRLDRTRGINEQIQPGVSHQSPDPHVMTDPQPAPGAIERSRPKPTENEGDQDTGCLLLLSQAGQGTNQLKQQLTSWGIKLKTVESSVQAFTELYTSAQHGMPYQTVVVDKKHLDIDDSQFATALRTEPLLQSLYLIHYGGSTVPSRLDQLYNAGYSKVLQAPVDKTLLFSALHASAQTEVADPNVVRLLDHYAVERGQQPLEILLGCNSESEARKLRRMLTAAGHQPFLARDGSETLDALDNHHFDLAIVTADMPDISGIEAIKLYRFTHMNQPWVPFIVLLDKPDSQIVQCCENADIQHLLVNPVSSRQLLECIDNALNEEGHNNEVYGYHPTGGQAIYHDNELILDTHQLDQLTQLGHDTSFLQQLIPQFASESGELVDQLKQALTTQDLKQVNCLGHQLKDSAGNLGALSLYRLAVRTSRLNKSNPAHELDRLAHELEDCRQATIGALHGYLSEGDNSAYKKD